MNRINPSIIVALVLLALSGCARDTPSGLDLAADSVAASQPIVPDTIRSSARNAQRLRLVREIVIPETADSTSPTWLSGASRMAVTSFGFALYSNGGLKHFDNSGKLLWQTSPFEFAPGQAVNAKRSAFGGRGGTDVGDWIEWMFDKDARAPGAISNLNAMQWAGDSLVMLAQQTEVQIYNRTGRSVAITGVARADGWSQVSSISNSVAGWMFVSSMSPPRPVRMGETPPRQDSVAYAMRRVSIRNGAIGPPLRIWKAGRQAPRMIQSGSRSVAVYPMISATPFQRLGSGKWFTSNGQDFQFEVFDEYGRLARAIIIETERVRVTPRMIEELAENSASRYRERAEQGDSLAIFWLRDALPILRELKVPDHRPVVGGAWIGDDGSIAVRRADLNPRPGVPGDSLMIDIVGRDGKYQGRVAFAQPDLTVVHFTGNAFYVAEKAGTLRPSPPDGKESPTEDTYVSGGRVIRARDGTTVSVDYQRLVRYTIAERY